MRYILLMVMALQLFAVDATLTIEKDVEHRSKIALEDGSSQPENEIFNLFLSDLKISGHFLADTKHYRGRFDGALVDPSLKAQEYVLKYRVEKGSGVVLTIRLLKGSDTTTLLEKRYAIPHPAKVPFMVHKAVYDINHVLGYKDIDWINRYVVFSRYTAPKRSEIVLADYTFHYQKVIIRGGLNLFPKWADSRQRSFFYTSFRGVVPTLYRLNIYTGKKTKIASSEGMMICSDVTADGKKILATMAPNGQPDIYEITLATGAKKRLTRFNGIDVSGRYIENEQSIAFVSNRLGHANLFKKHKSATAVSQLVYHGKGNNMLDTYENKVVYASRESSNPFGVNRSNIYLTDNYGGMTRPLTTLGNNQFPRFSSDGNIVLYLRQQSGSTSVGYTNLQTKQSLLFPFHGRKIQAIDW